ncbi:MAG: putative toxin-antitoxin system toxin component, PIN family [Pyrinomonadaceae bacterium]
MPLPKVVLDTNVVVSALLSARGNEALILDLCLAQKLQLYVSKDILTEYEEVLGRPRFRIDLKHVTAAMQLIRKAAKTVKPTQALAV